jgi:hypothetical protein
MINSTKLSAVGRFNRLVFGSALALLIGLFAASAASAALFESVGVSIDRPPAIEKKFDEDPFSPTFLQTIELPVVNHDGTFVDPEFERQAGSHPDLSVAFRIRPTTPGPVGSSLPAEAVKDVDFDLPEGMVGNASGIPTCSPEGLANSGVGGAHCPTGSQVGIAELVAWAQGGPQRFRIGLFNISHGPDIPARFGFNFANVVGLITAHVRPGDYGISSGSFSISQAESVEFARITLWGVPADPSHDWLRQGDDISLNSSTFNTPLFPPRPSSQPRVPFLTLPPACTGQPLEFTIHGDSWENPGVFDTRTLTADEDGTPFTMERCDRLAFNPAAAVQPTSHTADAPTGVNVEVNVPQPQDPDGLATAHVRKTKMVFPEGMSVSPSSAAGLGACSEAQIGLGSNDAPSCPQSSVLGKVTIDTPLLEEQLKGDIVLAQPYANPFNSLVALYITAKGPGFYLKLPGRADLDPVTGQVTATFDETPQLPFSKLRVEFPGGPDASLATPPSCGAVSTKAELTSWASSLPVALSLPMSIDQGCSQGPNAPSFTAGTTQPMAGTYAPFAFHATRADRTPYLSRIDTTLPPGLLANLGSVTRCAGSDAAAGTCPASSRIGSTSTLAGPGALPLPVKGDVYLTGPYKNPATGQDAPFGLSIAVPTAGQAGPFDLGTVVVRAGIYVDPTDTHVTVKSDPLPTIIKGIPLRLRQVNLEIDRPEFTLNPTNCQPKSIGGSFDALGAPTNKQTLPFQVGGCGELAFKPKLALKFTGQTHRSAHPALKATLRMPKGGANIAKTTVLLPETEFIDNAHITNPCTRVQFDAGQCPKSSILGTATATTPLLDEPLRGPVYFRSNGGARELPDLVADLNGPIHVTLVGFIDSVKTGPETSRVRTRFLSVPDAPVSKFVLNMKGGDKGLIVNTEELCKVRPRARAEFTGQNGKRSVSNPLVKLSCGGGKKRK